MFSLLKIVPTVLLIFLGMGLRWTGFFSSSTVEDLKKIIVNICLPVLLFNAFAQSRLEARYLTVIIAVLAACLLMLFLGILVKKIFRHSNPYFPTVFSGFEAGMMGYALFASLVKAELLYTFAIIDLGQALFVFFVLSTFIKFVSGERPEAKELVLTFLKNPIILAILLGIVTSLIATFFSLPLWSEEDFFGMTIELISRLNTPLICIVLGYGLKLSLKGFLKSSAFVLLRLAIALSLATIINIFIIRPYFSHEPIFSFALYTHFILPPPFVIPIFMPAPKEALHGVAASHKIEREEILNILSTHIVFSIVALAIVLNFFAPLLV